MDLVGHTRSDELWLKLMFTIIDCCMCAAVGLEPAAWLNTRPRATAFENLRELTYAVSMDLAEVLGSGMGSEGCVFALRAGV